MANILKNIILMLILSTVIVMMIGILFYDFIPNRTEVKEANEYLVEEKTTKTLATIKEEEESLFGKTVVDSEGNIDTIIHSYSLDAGDLKVYEQSNSYESGKSDPFDDVVITPDSDGTGNGNNGSTSVGGTTNNNNSSGNGSNGNNTVKQENDGTLFNSTTSK